MIASQERILWAGFTILLIYMIIYQQYTQVTVDGIIYPPLSSFSPPPPPVIPVATILPCPRRPELKSIAFPLSVTSQKITVSHFKNLPLFRHALPTILSSIELDRYDYRVDIAVDSNDKWYDNSDNIRQMTFWWIHMHQISWPTYDCYTPLVFTVFNNTRNRNTWAVNYVTEIEYHLGYDAFYRINDDTSLYNDQWSTKFFDIMDKMQPMKGVGVTGPYDAFHRGKFLTHSFVTRKHVEIFGTHFNYLYGNWYSDNWIQEIYSAPFGSNTILMVLDSNVTILHHLEPARYVIQATLALHKKQVIIDVEVLRNYLKL